MKQQWFFSGVVVGSILTTLCVQARRPYHPCSQYAAKRWKSYSTKYAEKMFNAITHHAPMTEIRRLAEAYPDVLQARDANGRTPLHWAAADGMIFAVELFLSLGADVDAQDVRGNTPLHSAVVNTSNLINRLNTITVLMSEGASPILRNEEGLNTFDLAKSFGVQSHLYDLSRRRVDLVRHAQETGRRVGRLLRESQEEVERYFGQSESVAAQTARMKQGQEVGQPVYGGFVRAADLANSYDYGEKAQSNAAEKGRYQEGDEFISVFEKVEKEERARIAQKAAALEKEAAVADNLEGYLPTQNV